MTVRIRAARAAEPEAWQIATGMTLPHAVRVAVRKLGLGPGRTVRSWEDAPFSGSWHWDWSGTLLQIVVLDEFGRSNCGAGSASLCKFHPGVCDACRAASQRSKLLVDLRPQPMTIELSPEGVEEMDRGAAAMHVSRSRYIETLLMRERAAFRTALGQKNVRDMLRKRDCRCGAHPGRFHNKGCDVERCALCGGQAIACDCVYVVSGLDPSRPPKDVQKHGPRREMLDRFTEAEEDVGGRLPWEGYYPGTAECVELGWFTRYVDASGQPVALPGPGGRWERCEAADEFAAPDISRLHADGHWDSRRCRVVIDEPHVVAGPISTSRRRSRGTP